MVSAVARTWGPQPMVSAISATHHGAVSAAVPIPTTLAQPAVLNHVLTDVVAASIAFTSACFVPLTIHHFVALTTLGLRRQAKGGETCSGRPSPRSTSFALR